MNDPKIVEEPCAKSCEKASSLLLHSARNPCDKMMKYCLDVLGANPLAQACNGIIFPFFALIQGNYHLASYYVKSGLSTGHERSSDGGTLLHWACANTSGLNLPESAKKHQYEFVVYLVEEIGVDLFARHMKGHTALAMLELGIQADNTARLMTYLKAKMAEKVGSS